MAEFLDLPTIIIIGAAIVVLLRLRSVLGTRTGTERPPANRRDDNNETDRKSAGQDNNVVVPLHALGDPASVDEDADRALRKFEVELDRFAGDNAELRDGLAAIGNVDSSFTPKIFQSGAASAYEMVVTAFAAGDRKTLKELLDKEVYSGFESAINERESQKYTVQFTFVGLPNIEYIEASLEKRVANVTMRFDAEVVSATKDADGTLIEGHEEQVVNIADEWTFSRNTKSRDPNWKLVATSPLS